MKRSRNGVAVKSNNPFDFPCVCDTCPFAEYCTDELTACCDFSAWVSTGVIPGGFRDRRRWRGVYHAMYNIWRTSDRHWYYAGLDAGLAGKVCKHENQMFMLGCLDGWENINAKPQEVEGLKSAVRGLNRAWIRDWGEA